jgi:hypothetical protein
MTKAFKDVITNIINTGTINQNDYADLSNNDKKIIDLIFSSHLNYKLHNQEFIDELINRFNIIKGEIMIGNNNPDLLKELKIIALQLMDYNVLDFRQINNLLRYLFYLI